MYAITTPRCTIDYELRNLVQKFSPIREDLKKSLQGIYLHSGRTDGNGGHHDWLNRTGWGIGSYHYHHKLPAHLHPNGKCPYGNTKSHIIVNPYTGKEINIGIPYIYEDGYYFSLNLVCKSLTAQDKFGANLGLGTGINPSFPGGSFYACPAGNSSIDVELGENLSFTYPKNILGFVQDNKFFKTDCGKLQLLCHNKQVEADDAVCYAYISLETIGEYMIKDGYFTALRDDGSGVWSFEVRKPIVHILPLIPPENRASFHVGDEVTVQANIEHVASARLIVGKRYPMGYIEGFEECRYNLENQPTVIFSKFKLTEDVIGKAAIESGSLDISVSGHTGGTTIDAEIDARTLGDAVSIRIGNSEKASPTSASEDLITFLKNYEDFYDMPYRGLDSQNRTVGYGHVIDEITEGTKYDNGITEEEATELLKSDLNRVVYQYLNPWISQNSVILNQQQYDALTSFTFNAGPSWITTYEDLRKILMSNNITYEAMHTEFMDWIKVNGQQVLGLYRRRMDELNIFFNGDYSRNYPEAPDWF